VKARGRGSPGADYIVSEDEDILAIAEYEGVHTVRTAAFLKLLDTSR
jgi:hypothetical protein